MHVKDLIVTGDARILGNLYANGGSISGGGGSGGDSEGSGLTYRLVKDGSTIKLVGSDGSTSSVIDSDTIPTFTDTDTNTTYQLSKSGNTITLTGSDGSTSSVTDSNTDTNTWRAILTNGTLLLANTNSKALNLVSGSNITLTPDATNGKITISSTNTTYSAGTGISLSGTTFSNSGVRSISTGSTNGTISVNTNGSSANVAVKGLGSAAYTNSTAYAPAYQYSTTDLTPGVSSLATGTLYFVYE